MPRQLREEQTPLTRFVSFVQLPGLSLVLPLLCYFDTSRLDYCNALCIGLPVVRLKCLDRVLRSAACLISRVSNLTLYLSICVMSPINWLPLSQRIEFRVANNPLSQNMGVANPAPKIDAHVF